MNIVRKKGGRFRIIHNKILFWIIIVLIILLVILIYFIIKNKNIDNNGIGNAKNNISEDKKCEIDDDCRKVAVTCCPCYMGGKEECVSRTSYDKYIDKIKNCSIDILCAAFENCKIKSCKCIAGECIG